MPPAAREANNRNATISVDPRHKVAIFTYYLGPLFGRGVTYTIIGEGKEIRIGSRNLLWVS